VPVEFHVVPDAGHIGAVVDRSALQLAVAFANRHLKGTSADGQ
jgi:hypothetical protein